jgi:hypothetical protein
MGGGSAQRTHGQHCLSKQTLCRSDCRPLGAISGSSAEHHDHVEEKRSEGIFSQARAAGIEMDELGDRMKARKQEVLGEYRASGKPAPETRTFTGRTLDKGEPV